MTRLRRGFFPIVSGEEVLLRQGGALGLVAKNNMDVAQGGGQMLAAGNNITISQGGSWVMGAGNSVSIHEGGAALLAARNVNAQRSFIGIALGKEVRVEDSNIIIGSAVSALVGLAVGLILGSRFGRVGTGDRKRA